MKIEFIRREFDFLRDDDICPSKQADYGCDWFLLECTSPAKDWRTMTSRIREWLILADKAAMSAQATNIELPIWLIRTLGREPSKDEYDAHMKLYFATPPIERYLLKNTWGGWAPSDFLYWFSCEMRQFLIHQFVGGPSNKVIIAVAGVPVPLEAFELLVAAAADVPQEEVKVLGI